MEMNSNTAYNSDFDQLNYTVSIYSEMERSDSLMSEGEEKERLELFISCRNLDDLDLFTVTDSFLVVKLIEENRPEKVILKTKVYWNDLNPNYAETVLVDFFFEIRQKLIFQVFHYGTPAALVGRLQTSIGEIFGSPEHGLIKNLLNKGNKSAGKIIVRCEKEEICKKQIATIRLRATGLPNMKWWYFFGGTNAFYRIFRRRKEDQLLVYQSQAIASTEPSWGLFRMSERRLTSNDENRDLEMRIYNFSANGKHQIIGSVIFKLKDLNVGRKFDILDRNKNRAGTLIVDQFKSQTQYQFGDFIQEGLQLALVNCIDFTASNGLFQDKNSLHYFNATIKSPYEKALEAVTAILIDYDYDKLVPVYGFGAKVKNPKLDTGNKVHHCFPLNFNENNPDIYQLPEVMKAYRNVMPYLQFSGPTKFAQLLKIAMFQSKKFKQQGHQYMILFILTDGQIHDKQEVIDLLIQCNYLPISIIIVGVGESQFTIMHELDDDNCMMVDSKGRKTERDLVQFVEFIKFKNNGVALAKQVLEELPRQVSEYFQLIHKIPQDVRNSYQMDDIERVRKFKQNMSNPYVL